MASTNPQSEKESDQKVEDTSDNEEENTNSNKDNEEWDGKDRRSKERPWSDKENKEPVLSKEEREALSGDVEELSDSAGVISYDFYSPAHINKSNLPALGIINERVVELLNENFDELFKREIEVTADDIDICKYGEFINSLPNLVDVNQINITNIDAVGLLCMDGALIEVLMDAYFGGEGKSSDSNERITLTPAELSLSDKLINIFIDSNSKAWKKLEQIDFELIQREPQPKLINLIEDSDLVVVCKFKVKLGDESSFIRIAYSYKSLEPIKHALRNVVSEQNDESNAQWKNQIFNSLKAVPIELKTVLAQFDLSVDQVTKLKQGDVIPFIMPESVIVYSSSTPIFKGKVGAINDAVAIRIDKWINRLEFKI